MEKLLSNQAAIVAKKEPKGCQWIINQALILREWLWYSHLAKQDLSS